MSLSWKIHLEMENWGYPENFSESTTSKRPLWCESSPIHLFQGQHQLISMWNASNLQLSQPGISFQDSERTPKRNEALDERILEISVQYIHVCIYIYIYNIYICVYIYICACVQLCGSWEYHPPQSIKKHRDLLAT